MKSNRHPNDTTSVLSWIEEWSQSERNPILYYQLQGEQAKTSSLALEDFVIIIQTEFQSHQMRNFAHKGICCDATHGTTGYDFKLTSLLIVDEFGEGFPVAWCLSNREDFSVLKVFCEQVKEKNGALSPLWFMSDIAQQFYDAFTTVFECNPKQLYCTWHVDKAWQEQLRKKVHRKRQRLETAEQLQPTEEVPPCPEMKLSKLKTSWECLGRMWSANWKMQSRKRQNCFFPLLVPLKSVIQGISMHCDICKKVFCNKEHILIKKKEAATL
eukprot:Seg3990.3 transcript_id=Seg3990.3/GoldUCD/mRNA.D3Y31 product="hypothetical protein" protein_id=Seg3990.3/GoldUCD/D3Y31